MEEFVVAYHKINKVKVRAFDERARADAFYEDLGLAWAKVLVNKDHRIPIRVHGVDKFVQLCTDVIEGIDSFLPTGSYRQTATRVEVKYNTKRREFSGRATCRTRDGDWLDNEFSFQQGEVFENIDGRMRMRHY